MQVSLPLVDAEETSGRAGPDFQVTGMKFDGAGSIDDGSGLVLAPDTHTVRIDVSNVGTGAGNAFLSLVHKGSPSAAESTVDTVDLGSISGGSATTTYLLSWTATTGPSQTLFARVSSANDGNPGNNEYRRDFDVDTLHRGTIIEDTLPSIASGNANVVLDRQLHSFNTTIKNDGVMPFSAVMHFRLTNVSASPSTVDVWSNTQIMAPGSTFDASDEEELMGNFSASTFSGLWNMSVEVVLNGSGWTETQVYSEFDVVFSDYISEMVGPSDITTSPGDSTTLYYIIRNTGSSVDSFTISVSSTRGWASTALDGTITQFIGIGQTTTLSVTVPVPANALLSDIDIVTLTITSAGSGYVLSDETRVMAGEYLHATVDLVDTTTMVIPGLTETVSFTVTNSGNADTSFDLTSGLSTNALNWNHTLSISNTGELSPGEFVTGFVTVDVPPIQMPLVTAEKNRAGNSLSVYVFAEADTGSIPNFDTAQIEVRPVIAIDPGLPFESITLSESEVLAAGQATGINEILGLNVQVRHNLESDITETVDADLQVGNITLSLIHI